MRVGSFALGAAFLFAAAPALSSPANSSAPSHDDTTVAELRARPVASEREAPAAMSRRSASLRQQRVGHVADGSVAQVSAHRPDEEGPSAGRTTLATAAAFVPGLALHGMGHYLTGDRKTAKRLLAWEAVGLGMAASGGAILGISGGSRYGNELTIPLLVSGVGLFLNTFVADVYGTASRGGTTLGYQSRPDIAVALDYAYIQEPQFSYKNFSVVSARFDRGSWMIAPLLWTALDANNQRARLPVRYDLFENDEGERLSVTTAATFHNFGDEGFSTGLVEASVEGRINLTRIGDSLQGSYTRFLVGYGLQRADYDIAGVDADYSGLLLARFGYGFYLPRGGSIEGYYDHRRDNFTAGLSPSDRNGSGFLGHFGLVLRQPLSERFALRARTEIGAAWLASAGLEFNFGGQN